MKQHPLHVHSRTHRKVVRAVVAFLLIVILFGLTAVPFTFSIPILTATKSDLLIVDNNANNAADPGDTIRYTNIFTNSGSTAATNVNFADTIDANTTLVAGSIKTTPIARHDSYAAIGNVGITVLPGSGVLVNDNDPDGGSVSVIPAAGGTANGGAFAIGSDGAFSYLPPTGFEGTDSFNYLIQDADGNQDPATVFVVVTEMIWFIDNSAASPGGGGLTTPFNSISAFNAIQTGSAPGAKDGDIVFLHSGSGNYTSGIVLRNGQTLIGQGAAASIESIAGITLPPFSIALPGTGGSRPIITNSGGSGIALGSGNLLRGLNVGDTSTGSGAGVNGSSVGNLTMLEMSITGQGKALDINGGTLNVTLDSVAVTSATNGGVSLQNTGGSTTIGALNIATTGGTGFLANNAGTVTVTGAANTVSSTNGTAVNLTNSTIGSSGITFLSVSAAGADTGITLNNTGSNSFTVTGSGTTDGSGGTLQTLNDHGIELISAQNVSISNMNLTNAATTQDVATSSATCTDEPAGTNTDCNAPVQMVNATNITLTNLTINGSVQHGINGNNVNGLTISNSDISNIGNENKENGMHFINLLGTVNFSNVSVVGSYTRNVLIENNTGTAVINLTNSTINTAQNEDGFFVIGGSNGGNNANITLNVTDSSFTHNGAGQLKAHAEDSSTVDVNITGNDFDGQPDVVGDFGIDLAVRDNANLTFDVIGTGANPQTFQPIRSHAINVFASGGGTASGTIDGNVIQESRVGAGVRVVAQVTDVNGFNPAITVAVQNNTISNIQGAGLGGIHVESRDGTSGLSGTANVQATLNNNSVTINGADSVIQALINGGNTMCLDVTNNSAAGAATSPFAGFGSTHYIGNPIPGNPLGGGNVTYDGYISGNLGGTWNANGNTPTLAAGISGEAYVDGTQPTNGTCATVAATANATTVVDAANAHTSTWAFADKIAAMQAAYQTAPASAKQANGESTALAAKDNTPVEAAAVATDKAASTAKPAQSGETVNVALGLLDPGQVVVITFDVTVDVTIPANVGQVCNQGVVSGDNFANVLTDDPDVGGVTDPTCTTLPRVDIEVTISDNPDPLEAGANGGVNNLVHTITVKNNGPAEATNIVIQFGANTVPAPSLSFSKGSQGPAGNEWSIPSLSVGESATLTLTFSIGTDYTLGYVSSSGTLTAVDQTDIDSGNDSAAENTTVIPYEVDIEVTISDSPDPVEAGANGGSNNLVHTITVKNNGPVEATNIVIQFGANTVPAPSLSFSKGSQGPAGNEWSIPSLSVGESATLTLTFSIGTDYSLGYVSSSGTLTAVDQTDTDSNNDSAAENTTVTFPNEAPVANNDNYSTNEDTTLVEATVGSLGDGVLANDTDADSDPLTAVLDTGTSNGVLVLNSDGSFTYTPTADTCGADSFTYHANDGTVDSNIATVDIDVVCVNDEPVANNDSYSTNEDTALVEATVGPLGDGVLANDTDVDGDGLTAVLDTGTSNGVLVLNSDGSFTYTPTTDSCGADSFTYHANDGTVDSNIATVDIDVVCVNDDPAVAADQATVTVDEGQTAVNTGTVDDVDGDTVALTASVGSVTNNGNGTWSWSFNTGDGPADSQTVTITADDGNGGSDQTSFALIVDNVAPTVDNITAPIDPVEIDSNVTVTVDFSDPAGTADEPYTCTFDYDNDGTVDETVTGVTGTSCDGTNTFTETGVFTVAVTVTDKDGDTGTAEYQYVVIFDPFGGYVTGSGRINSPAGAYYPDPTLTGQAVFGFFSEYKRGATIPTGQTEFHFHVAYLDFHSEDYDWLVVANHKAMFKGTGTLSGVGNYGFIISAVDADLTPSTGLDLFRIRIWDKDNGGIVIYDNQIVCSDMSEDADPCTTIAGGDIKILPSRAR